MKDLYRVTWALAALFIAFSGDASAARRVKICSNGGTDWPTCTAPSTSTGGTTTTTGGTTTTTTLMPKGATGTFTMSFDDEFSGTTLDTTKWNDHMWYEVSNATINYSVGNGLLSVWPQRDANGKFFNRTLDTDKKYSQTYGFFEMEARLPVGKGTWPGFWLFNHDLAAYPAKRPEIDIMEAYAGGGVNSGWSDANLHPTAFASTVWIDAGTLGGTKTLATTDLSAAFHTYGVDWQANSITFYFDGVPFAVVNKAMPDPMYVVLSMWFGSASGTPDSTTPTGPGNAFQINYIRAWKRN